MIVNPDSIEFESLDDLCIFVRYNSKNSKSVPAGYILAEDLMNNKGGVLYAKDTELDAARITRLLRILENNPEIKPSFLIKLNDIVLKIEHGKILAALIRLIESKASRKVYAKLMFSVKTLIESRINDILKEPEIILYISKLKFLEDKSKKSTINPFYNHTLNSLIFSMGITANLIESNEEKFEPKEIGEIGLVALLQNSGGWETSGQFMDLSVEERKKKFIAANEKNQNNLQMYNVKSEVLEAIDYCYDFQTGNFDFFQDDTKTAMYAKIACVGGIFNEAIAGLWGSARAPREVIDSLYLQTQANKIPKSLVDALAKGLKFNDLFDFYRELEVLNNLCKRDSGKAYPMTGFKSPVIFVCQHNLYDCKEFVASAKSITVFKEMGGLEEGSYGRCEGLSDKLIDFYEGHYKEIKDDVTSKKLKSGTKEDDNSAEEASNEKDNESKDT